MISQNSMEIVMIGAGPGGLFAANEIVEKLGKVNKILILGKGKSPWERKCDALISGCKKCKECELISGGGGAGLFSDGKLVFDVHSGGYLKEIISFDNKEDIENYS